MPAQQQNSSPTVHIHDPSYDSDWLFRAFPLVERVQASILCLPFVAVVDSVQTMHSQR